MITRALVLVTALLTLSSFYASADRVVYRWKDDAGNQVNSDRPPPQGVDYEVVSTSSSFVREVDAEEGVVPLEVAPTADTETKPVATSTPQIEKNPEHCKTARDNLQTLDSHARIRLRDEQGEYRYIDEDEKQQQRKLALDAIKAFCE